MQKFLRTLMLVALMLPFASQAQGDCTPISTYPVTYGFEASEGFTTTVTAAAACTTNVFNSCWRNEQTSFSGSTGSGRIWHIYGGTTTSQIHGGAHSLMLPDKGSSSAGVSTTMLVFPAMNFTSTYGYVVSFWIYRNGTGTSTPEGFKVYISDTDTIGPNAVELGHYSRHRTMAYPVTESASGWYQYETSTITMTGTVYLIFEGQSYYSSSTYVDDVVIEEILPCSKVTDLAVSTTTSNSITLTWVDAANTGATYTVSDASGVIASGISATTYTVTGLTANTEYTFNVTADCGNDGLSAPKTVTGRTACGTIDVLPWTDGMESVPTESYQMPYCWGRYTSAFTTTTTYPYSYSSTTAAHAGSRGLYFYGTTGATYPDTMVAILPPLDVTTYPMTGNRLTFWAKMGAATNTKLAYVGIMSDPTDINTFVLVDTIRVTGNTWDLKSVPLSNAVGIAGSNIAIMVLKGTGTMYIDDVTLEEMPSCLEVANLAVSNVTSSSMTLTWTDASNTNASYTVYAMADSSVIATGVTANTYTVTGLDANTQYTFGVQANCTAGNAGIMTVTSLTDCAVEVLPFTEDFSANLSSNVCWRGATGTTADQVFSGTALTLTTPNWTYASSANSGIAAGHYYKNIYGTSCKSWIITPAIDLSTVTSAQLSFDAVFTGYNSATAASGFESNSSQVFMVIVSADGGNTWLETNATKWQNENGNYTLASLAGTSYINQVISLNQFIGDTIKIAFYAQSTTSGGDNNLHIDNIAVTEVPSCLQVSGLTANATHNSVTLTWSDADNTGATYTVYNGTEVVATGITAMTYTINSLTSQTDYVFGVVANCSADDASSMVTIAIRTSAEPIMCGNDEASAYDNFDTITGTTNYFPGYSLYNYSYSEVIVPAARLVGLGEIKGMQFNVASINSGSSNFNNCEVYLMHTTATSLANGFIQDATNMQLVYTGDLNQVETGWQTVTFMTPFIWNGIDNILVAVRRNDGSWASSGTFASFTTTDTLARYIYQDAAAYTIGSITGGTPVVNIPAYRFLGCPVPVDSCAMTLPFVEDFEGADLGCWTNDGPGTWSIATGDYSTATGAYSGSTNAKITHSTTGSATKLISPAITGATNGLQLQFAHVQRSWAGDIDELRVYYRTDTGSAWQQLAAYTDAVPTWTVETINIPVAVYQVAFEYTDNYGYGVGLDSVVFNMPPSCMPVAALTVDSATATSVFLSWTGNAASYTVYDMSDTTVLGTTNTASYTVTGLTAMTSYTFGVVANCGSDISEIVTVNAGTACGGETCNISIVGADAYGDGWNGNAINVMQAGITIGTFTLTSGASNTESFSVCSGTPVAFAWVEGSYADEASFQILDGGNTTVHSVADGSTLVDGAVFYTLTDACPACLPAVVTVDTVAETSVTISWTGNAASYDVYNGTTFVTNTTATTYTFTGLTAATNYTFGVQAICSATDSASIASVNVMTACADVTTLPYSEGFENGLGCWTTVNGSADGVDWNAQPSFSSGAITPHTGNYMAASWSWNSVSMHANAWLISPKFVLPTVNAGDTLNFSWWDRTSAAYPDSYSVVLSTTTNDTAAFTTIIRPYGMADTTGWGMQTVDLTAYAGQSVYIAFHHVDYDKNYLLIDDITLSVGAAPAPVPDTLTVTFAVENPTMGTTVPAPGTYQYLTGDTVRFQAVPNYGYHFAGWIMSANGESDTLSNQYISAYFPANSMMSYGSMTMTALFEAGNPDSTTITYAVNDATMGTTVPAPGTHTIYVGNTIQATAIPNPGYMLNAWVFDILVAGNVASSDTLYTDDPDFANPIVFGTVLQSYVTTYNASFAITAIFAVDTTYVPGSDSLTVILAVNDTTMGTTTPAPGTYTYFVGDTLNLTVTANDGFHFENAFVSVTYMGFPVLSDTLDDLADLAMVNGTVVGAEMAGFVIDVMVNFAPNAGPQPTYWTVTLSSADTTMGTVSPEGDTEVLDGATFTATATAAEGYRFDSWVSGNTILSEEAEYTFTVHTNVALVAVFVSDTVPPVTRYSVTGVANDSTMGYVEGSCVVEDGTTVTLTAVANPGYHFVRWSTGETTESIQITVDGEDVTVTAYFETNNGGVEDADMNEVTIYSTESRIIIRGAEGNSVYVFDVNGRLVNSNVNATETVEFRMANTGVYLVKVGAAPAKRVLVVR